LFLFFYYYYIFLSIMTVLPQDYLRSLKSIRQRCEQVYEKAKRNELVCFEVDETALPAIVDHVAETTKRRYADLDKIPPHSRLRHFNPSQIQGLRQQWDSKHVDSVEQARRLIDLVIVSVLVDAGAGQQWRYKTKEGQAVGRSEGLALASFDMFSEGYFSSSTDVPDRVDGKSCEILCITKIITVLLVRGLNSITIQRMTEGFQVSNENPMVGLEGRSNLLKRLAKVLDEQPTYFPSINQEPRRPGNLVGKVNTESNKHLVFNALI
jgi:hypothetical protein